MKRLLLTVVCLGVAVWAAVPSAREAAMTKPVIRIAPDVRSGVDSRIPGVPLRAAAAADTTWLGEWNFEGGGAGCDPQGWVSADVTAQTGDYFHVDDFAGLGGGATGRLVPIEGAQSMWCGARPASTVPLCGYATLPGYGNSWNQAFCTANCLPVDSVVTIDYLASWDSEPGYDATTVEIDACDDQWTKLYGGTGVLDGTFGPVFRSNVVQANEHNGSLRVRFRFVSDSAWSDQDGLWSTDGAFLIDSLSISDKNGFVLAVEDFEDETTGDIDADDWVSCTPVGYGDFSGLFPGISVAQRDPCSYNATCIWGFFNGSTADYSCGGYPAQAVVPYVNSRNQYISNEVWSPTVPFSGSGTTVELAFDVYRELPLNALIFFIWHVRSWTDGCPGGWKDFNFVYYGAGPDWSREVFSVGTLIEPGAQDVQTGLGVVDMCPFWCGMYGTGECHSHSPLIDNVDLYRIDTRGPVWANRDIDMFQDNFATDGTLTGTVRVDMANNTNNWSSSHNIIPGDSVVVSVEDPDNGLKPDPYTGTASAVYCLVSVWPQGQADKRGTALTQDAMRFPVVDSLTYGGDTWFVIRCDSTKSQQGYYNPVSRFCIDLNDNLFVPGDTVCFVFRADSDAPSTGITYWSRATGTTDDLGEALTNPMEFTCLPAGGYLRGGDILYCDDFDGRGAQPYFDTAFQMLGIDDMVDRYDTRGPSSVVGNSLGGRVVDVYQQLIPCYRYIVWNTGNLSSGTIGDGSGGPDYADDATLLATFLGNHPQTGGLYISGDDVATELKQLAGTGVTQLLPFINYTLVNGDHTDANYPVSPLVIGTPGSMFNHPLGPDSMVAYGGCPLINDFDVLAPAGAAQVHMTYGGYSVANEGAVVAQKTVNSVGTEMGVVLSGFSFHYIRDARHNSVPARADHIQDIILWMGHLVSYPVGAGDPPPAASLAQNYPNPFNPVTTIEYTVGQRSQVNLRVFNVAGQLVRTLVNDVREPGLEHKVVWNGHNDAGLMVSSGVYFYKLVTPDFTRTRKMVLLK